MADLPYSNETTQSERREVLRNDTYFARQQNTPDDAGGRYAKLTPATITGATPSPQYPQLPPSSPWANGFDENVEPPLGIAVDEMPAVGTPTEIQSSLAPNLATVVASPPDAGDRVRGASHRINCCSLPGDG